MGSPPDEFDRARDNEEQVQVTLTHDFLIGEYEVTRAEWASVGLAPPPPPSSGGNSDRSTHRVKQKKPNAWGLYDVSGNAMEWVNDGYTPLGYGPGPLTDPNPTFPIEPKTTERVTRGGKVTLWSFSCRSAARFPYPYYARIWTLGFRLARTL